MNNELKIKYESLLNWLEIYKGGFYPYERGCVLMNNDATGFVASKICQEVFGVKNTLNVIIPCYSNIEYLTKSSSFSRNCGVEIKNIGLKQVYDDIIELDYDQKEFTDEEDQIKDYLRDKIIDVICKKNSSYKLEFKKIDENYFIKIYSDINLSIPFTLEDIKELTSYFKIDDI